MSHRIERFSSTLKQCLAEIIMSEMNDPRLQSVLITGVVVSPDLKKARVFITSFQDDVEGIVSLLGRAKGFLKRALAKKMYVKYVPELIFIGEENTNITQPGQSPVHLEDENEEKDC